jgi:hypothetical protein
VEETCEVMSKKQDNFGETVTYDIIKMHLRMLK